MEHSDLFSQPAEVVEYASTAEKSDEPVQHPVFSDREDYHGHGTKPASS